MLYNVSQESPNVSWLIYVFWIFYMPALSGLGADLLDFLYLIIWFTVSGSTGPAWF